MNSAVNALEGVTQQNAAMFEETAATINSLHMLTDELVDTSAQFVIGAGSNDAPLAKAS